MTSKQQSTQYIDIINIIISFMVHFQVVAISVYWKDAIQTSQPNRLPDWSKFDRQSEVWTRKPETGVYVAFSSEAVARTHLSQLAVKVAWLPTLFATRRKTEITKTSVIVMMLTSVSWVSVSAMCLSKSQNQSIYKVLQIWRCTEVFGKNGRL